MIEPPKPIAVVRGATSPEIQGLFAAFVESIRPDARVVGVVEDYSRGAGRKDTDLRSLTDAHSRPIFQDLGQRSTACSVDADSVAMACEAVRRDIAAGCDLVVLSKFAKLEADRGGLSGAFIAALEAQAPILTSVAPKFDAQWAAFAAPLFVILPPELDAIRAWWRGVAPQGA